MSTPYHMSDMLELMFKNPDKLLPKGFEWSDYVEQDMTVGSAAVFLDGALNETEIRVPPLSPCCNVEIGGMVTENILGLCRNCGCVVMEFNLTRSSLRQAVRKAEIAA